MNVNEMLKNWFIFNEWRSYDSEPFEFENNLKEFGKFKVYNNFRNFLEAEENEIYLDITEMENIDDILDNKECFDEFVKVFHNGHVFWEQISYEQINKPFLHATLGDPAVSEDHYFKMLDELKSKNDIINFLNFALVSCGEVTHARGLINQFEITDVAG